MSEPAGDPRLDKIAKPSGGSAGGEHVTLTGSLLQHIVGVTFGETPATNVTAASTEVTCTTPAHAPGSVDVIAVDDEGNKSNAVKYMYT
jgi:IPT/TIG domain